MNVAFCDVFPPEKCACIVFLKGKLGFVHQSKAPSDFRMLLPTTVIHISSHLLVHLQASSNGGKAVVLKQKQCWWSCGWFNSVFLRNCLKCIILIDLLRCQHCALWPAWTLSWHLGFCGSACMLSVSSLPRWLSYLLLFILDLVICLIACLGLAKHSKCLLTMWVSIVTVWGGMFGWHACMHPGIWSYQVVLEAKTLFSDVQQKPELGACW